jgi:hypothetical protein
MPRKSVPASVTETAFDCPHCGAYTTQYWYQVRAKQFDDERPLPFILSDGDPQQILKTADLDAEHKAAALAWAKKALSRRIWFESKGGHEWSVVAGNIHLSRCYACDKVSVWIHNRLVDPTATTVVQPNADLPDGIASDFNEARAIVASSPRGAAALLRLAVQKLCKHLGESGKNIDADIAALVKKGLNPVVQQSLDVVRVIGNESVHPGTLDLRDDPTTAHSLFGLVNAIAEQMISYPKHVADLYAKLPQAKRDAIQKRDGGPGPGGVA